MTGNGIITTWIHHITFMFKTTKCANISQTQTQIMKNARNIKFKDKDDTSGLQVNQFKYWTIFLMFFHFAIDTFFYIHI